MVGNSFSLEVHGHQNAVPQPNQAACVAIAVNLGKFRVAIPDDMVIDELSFVSVEAIGNKDGNIILPSVARRCREQYPVVRLGNFQERLGPGSIADDPLLVKYKECVSHIRILGDIVPRVHHNRVFVIVSFRVSGEEERSQLPLPLKGIPFPGGGNDVKTLWVLHWPMTCIKQITALLLVIVRKGCARLTAADATAQDTSVFHPIDGVELIVIETYASHGARPPFIGFFFRRQQPWTERERSFHSLQT